MSIKILNGGTATPFPSALNAPTNVTASNPTSSSIDLAWTAPTQDSAIEYRIRDNSDDSLVKTVTWPSTGTTISGLTPETAYTFYVVTSDGTKESPKSNTATETTGLAPAVTRVFVDQTLSVDIVNGSYSVVSRDNSGSAGDAYNTLQKAIDNHIPGNHIILRGSVSGGEFPEVYTGCWVLPLNLNGSSWAEGDYNYISSCNTTNGGFENEWVVLDGNYDCGAIGSEQGGQVIGYGVQSTTGSVSSYWKFERIEIRHGNAADGGDPNKGGFGFHGNGGPFWFKHCYIHDNKGLLSNGNMPSGVYGYNWKNCIVEECWVQDNGDIEANNNGHNIAWCSQYPHNVSQATIASDGFSTGLQCGYDENNEIKYNLCVGSAASIGRKHFSMLTGREPATADFSDAHKDKGNKIHHNIVRDASGPAIGAHSDFDQVHHNIIDGCAAGVWIQYGYISYWNLYKTCIYNNVVVNPSRREVVMSLGQKIDAAHSPVDLKYVFNNIMDNAGGSNFQWVPNESAITLAVDPTLDASNSVVSHNYAYRQFSAVQYSINGTTYTTEQFKVQTVTTAPRVAYSNSLDGGNLLYQSETGNTAYVTEGTHQIEAGVTVADGGIGGAHPYLAGVTIPSYVGATDPTDNGWVAEVNVFNVVNVNGVPTNLRDGIGIT